MNTIIFTVVKAIVTTALRVLTVIPLMAIYLVLALGNAGDLADRLLFWWAGTAERKK